MIAALRDLYSLLNDVERTIGCTIQDKDFVIGRQQLFSVFLHEAVHSFISNKAGWIHDLPDDQVDYVDEVLVRIMIHDLVEDLGLAGKLGEYYLPTTMKDLQELLRYGIKITAAKYESFRGVWRTRYYPTWDLDGMAKFLLKSINGTV